MIKDIDVPEQHLTAFRRIRRKMPSEMQANREILERIVLYLKFGGEKLALHYLDMLKRPFDREFIVIKRRPTEDADSEEDEESEDEEIPGDSPEID